MRPELAGFTVKMFSPSADQPLSNLFALQSAVKSGSSIRLQLKSGFSRTGVCKLRAHQVSGSETIPGKNYFREDTHGLQGDYVALRDRTLTSSHAAASVGARWTRVDFATGAFFWPTLFATFLSGVRKARLCGAKME